MKKHFYILTIVIITLVIPFLAQAQTNYEDVVYLKNGSIIHGIIIEQVPNQTIKIQTKDRNVFVYKMDEVEKMTKEKVENSNGSTNFSNNDIKQSGYTNVTELNFGIGTGDASNDLSYGIQTINGYQFNPLFYLGLGLGIDRYKELTYVPIFIDFRINFLSASVTPFFEAAAGYSLAFSNNSYANDYISNSGNYYYSYNNSYKGGVMLNPSFGVKFFVSPKAALNFSIGYRYQENNISANVIDPFGNYLGNQTVSIKENEGLITIKLGATF